MNEKLANIKKKLLQRKDELEVELTRLSKERVIEEQAADPADQASASTMEELNISLQNNDREEYARIIKALAMIDAGTYGKCTDCEQPLSEKRLQLYPNATRCLACQEALEDKSEKE